MRLLAIALLSSCANNAILELEVSLPSSDRFALPQVRPAADHPFEQTWGGEDLAAIALPERTVDHISVIGDGDTGDVHLKLRFCASEDCLAVEDANAPELWYRFEQPFYVGETTFFELEIGAVPTTLPTSETVIERCAIRGCVDGTTSSYCRSDGSHVCEDPT